MQRDVRYIGMAAGYSVPRRSRKAHGRTYLWFQRNERRLLAADVVCVALLFLIHLGASAFQAFAQEIAIPVQILDASLLTFLAVSVAWKGVVPLVICILGVVLIQYSALITYYPPPESQTNTGGTKFTYPFSTPTVGSAANMHFFLGISMVIFGMIIAYRPHMLFARNRPESLESEWSKYQVWYDSSLLADGRQERSVPVKNLMNEQDRYLLWRYEYVLADIYGTPHLVKPDGLVPKDSHVFRDRDSGLVMGKARYNGFFM